MRYVFPVLIGLLGAAVLLSLGVWQMQRLAWKQDMLAQIEAKISAAPLPLPVARAQGLEQFQAVSVSGRFEPLELHVLSSVKGVGAIYRIISPFITDEGTRIMIDRGFIPADQKDTQRPFGEALDLVGNFRTVEETDGFTPPPDWDENILYARNVPQMAERLQTEEILIILRESSGKADGIRALPVDASTIPNDHLQYMVTWFSLAAVWLGMTALWIARIRNPKNTRA